MVNRNGGRERSFLDRFFDASDRFYATDRGFCLISGMVSGTIIMLVVLIVLSLAQPSHGQSAGGVMGNGHVGFIPARPYGPVVVYSNPYCCPRRPAPRVPTYFDTLTARMRAGQQSYKGPASYSAAGASFNAFPTPEVIVNPFYVERK
jgi:hypothetical protein